MSEPKTTKASHLEKKVISPLQLHENHLELHNSWMKFACIFIATDFQIGILQKTRPLPKLLNSHTDTHLAKN